MYYGLGLPLFVRISITALFLAPVGFFMGMPFPKGIEIISRAEEKLVPWAWGVNGAFSVVAGVTAALIAISYGFKVVFIVGSALYLGAWFFIREPSPQM